MSSAYIPLQGQFPQIQSPLSMAQGVQSLRNGATQNQLTQQQVQAAQMQNQMTQMELQQQRLFVQAMQGGAQGPSDGSQGKPQPAAPQPSQSGAVDDTGAPMPAGSGAPAGAPMPMSQIPGTAMMAPGGSPTGMGAMPAGQPAGMGQALAPGMGAQPGMGMGAQPSAQPNAQPSAQPNAQPSGQASGQPGQQRPNFSAVGDRMQDVLNRFMAAPGANPLYAMKIYGGMIDQQTKMAALTKDQLANQKQIGDSQAGELSNIVDAPADQKAGLYQNHLDSSLQQRIITPQQYQQLQLAGLPNDEHLRTAANGYLLRSEQVDQASKMATAQENIARGLNFRSEAAGRDLTQHAQIGIATMPTDPQKFDDWKNAQPQDIQQQVLQGVNDPVNAKRILTAVAVPLPAADKLKQEQEVSKIQELTNLASNDPTGRAYAAGYGALKITHPTLAAQMPDPLNFDPKTYPNQVYATGLTPEQKSQQGYHDVTAADREARAQALATQTAFMNGIRMNYEGLRDRLAPDPDTGLTKAQTLRQWDAYRTSDQKDYNDIANLNAQINSGKWVGGTNNGNALSAQDKTSMQAKLAAAQTHLQDTQMGRARLMGVDTVDPNDVTPGTPLPSSKPGMVWQKNNGIAYITSAPKPKVPVPDPGTVKPGTPNPPVAPPVTPPATDPRANPDGTSVPGTPRLGGQHGPKPGQQNNAPAGTPPPYTQNADGTYTIYTPSGHFAGTKAKVNAFLKTHDQQPIP